MKILKRLLQGMFVLGAVCPGILVAQEKLSLENESISLQWQYTRDGYKLSSVSLDNGSNSLNFKKTSGLYTILYSSGSLDSVKYPADLPKDALQFPPEEGYSLIDKAWQRRLHPVEMNVAGDAYHFFPDQALREKNGLRFLQDTEGFSVESDWSLHPEYQHDVLVTLTVTAKKAGYYSIASPTLHAASPDELAWGTIPGHFQGNELQPNFVLGYGYGQGIPDRPVLTRERTAGTLTSLISLDNGATIAVIPEPGTGRKAWRKNKNTHTEWRLGLSLMNRQGELSPTAYHPVLGEKDSYLKAGESRTFQFRYSIQAQEWYDVYKHAVYNVYHFKDILDVKQTGFSLTNRLLAMLDYVVDDSTSMWNVHEYQGKSIGAQSYLGAVVGSDKDAMKNSDYGAMWMLAELTGDTVLRTTRLPYARNFKLVQSQGEEGFFQGAAIGQYYLQKSRRFTEEWGDYVEPIALTYYTMLDIGNILLYESNDHELRERLRLGAERLLHWQKEDGSWEVAYDRETEAPRFADLTDLRPTFYGLLVAYRILGEQKYLDAACKGADWFLKHAVEKGHFLGVCGDFRFVPDFATGQSAQALLDLYDLTDKQEYLDAAVQSARIYTGSIYTHAMPEGDKIMVKDQEMDDWQLTQVGFSFEHGSTLGSATRNGPIFLASHAGMFVRLFSLTQDSLFLDMARAGSWAQDAFMEPETKVASYYWKELNGGALRFPHHAWWQIGWIADYLLAEMEMRSGGAISFPRGFITPKVGPHQPYGFADGKVFGKTAKLWLPKNLLQADNPMVDYIGAVDAATKDLYVILANNSNGEQLTRVQLTPNDVISEQHIQTNKLTVLDENGLVLHSAPAKDLLDIAVPKHGLRILKISY